jgi:ABC-type multidrug transport system permease subunit
MKRILDLGHNELRLFLKSRVAYVWLFAIPLLFVYLMGFAARAPRDPSNRFPPVLVENRDAGLLGAFLIEELAAHGLRRLDPDKEPQVKPARGLRIPADFSARVLARQATNVEYFTVAGSNAADAALIEFRVVRALVAVNSHLLEASNVGQAWPPSPEALRAVREKPGAVKLDARFAGRRPVPTGISFSLPGNLVSFLLMNLLIFGGATVATSRRAGVLRRLLTLPLRRSELIAGQIYGLWLLGLVQIVFFLLVGRFVFDLNLGANLLGVALVLFVFAWVAAALGVLVGSVLESPEKIVGVCVLASLLMAAVGGCWFPLEIAPDWMKLLAHTVPTGWALEALHQLISFGSELDAVLTPLLVLAGFGAAATAAAARCFRV